MLPTVKLEFFTLRHPGQKHWEHSLWGTHGDSSLFHPVSLSLVCISCGQPDATSHWSLLTGDTWTHWYSHPKLLEPAASESVLHPSYSTSPWSLSHLLTLFSSFTKRKLRFQSVCLTENNQLTNRCTFHHLGGHRACSCLRSLGSPII